MMGFGPAAGVFAGHVTVLCAAALLLWRFVPLARHAEAGADDRALMAALRGLPISALLVAMVAVAEAVYYGVARVMAPYGIDLWSEHPAVWLLRLAVATAVMWHMPAYFRWRGHRGWAMRKLVARDVAGLMAIWLATLVVVW